MFRRTQFKRRFSQPFLRGRRLFRGNGRKFFRRSTQVTSTASATRAMTVYFMNFKGSRFSKMSMPDRFLTWMSIELQGGISTGAGSNTGTFGFALNDIVFPFNKPGPVGVTLPNPVQAVNAWNPQMLKNFLFNATTNTGIYNQYRVWASEVNVSMTPGNAADTVNICMCPLAQAATAYTGPEAISSGPNSVVKISTFGGSGASCTMTALWSMPALAGCPKNLYPAFASALGTASTTPGLPYFVQVGYRTDDAAMLTAVVGVRIVVRYHVEFLNRADSQLLNS